MYVRLSVFNARVVISVKITKRMKNALLPDFQVILIISYQTLLQNSNRVILNRDVKNTLGKVR